MIRRPSIVAVKAVRADSENTSTKSESCDADELPGDDPDSRTFNRGESSASLDPSGSVSGILSGDKCGEPAGDPKLEDKGDSAEVSSSVDKEAKLDPEHADSKPNASDAKDAEVKKDTPTAAKSLVNPMSTSSGPDNQTLLRLLEEGEELQSMFRCARVCGLDTNEGLLLFGKEHYYVVDGYTLLKTREIRDLDFLPEEFHDPIIPYTATGTARCKTQRRQCSKFAYEDIREVHKRRYLLQPIALEVFSSDGRNYLLAFPRRTRNKVLGKFVAVGKNIIDAAHQSVSGQKNSASMESSGSILSSLIGETSVTQRWVRGEISNFQYLMHVNTLAGRSYNDLMQYPVFPWILADYDSEELDFLDPATFRDLSKPMGAQTPDRLEMFLKRYREWDDPTGEIPPYMYGTHYSSAMIVVSYMVRIEPFTQQFLKLQGGHFDLADRMFHSIREAWYSASKNNMADVKELIPEFFYLPDCFINANHFDLGVKQNGVALHDVVLPPWAKGDHREFIRVHREALESDYVSAHLHEWIDLIFGYKQTGQPAVEAANLYHHLFYEGNVDFEAIDDPLILNATIGFINNFGQIPSQLFKKPHPQKKIRPPDFSYSSPPGISRERAFYHCLDNLKPPPAAIKELKSAVGQIVQTERGTVCAVEQNKVIIPPSYAKYIAWGFPDRTIRLGQMDTDKSICIHETMDFGDVVCAACPNNRTVVTGGTATVVSVWEIVTSTARGTPVRLRLRKSMYGHTEPISALAASGSFGIIVSGSQDGTCIVWDLSTLSLVRQLGPHPAAVACTCINECTGDIATCAGSNLYLYSMNGLLLASVNASSSPHLDRKQIILSVAFSSLNEWDVQNVVMTGSNDGVVRLWSLEYVQVPTSESTPSPVGPNGSVKTLGQQQPEGVQENLDALRDINPETIRRRLMEQSVSPSPGNGSVTSMDRSDTFTRMSSHATSPEQDGSPSRAQAIPPSHSEGDSGAVTPITNRISEQMNKDSERQSTDSFVFVNQDGFAMIRTPNRLKPGFKWQRQLMFRSKLTTHTAFDRKDNLTPAAVTAIAPSRDHKQLFVGDARGRVFAWGVSDEGTRADHWVQDPSRSSCTKCGQRFSFSERRHHCRNCGQIFCAKCSKFESEIKHMKISKPVRVCQQCYQKLKAS